MYNPDEQKFDACLPQVAQPVRIRSLHDAQVFARRWVIRYARARNGKSMADNLAGELMDAANGVGASIKRREDTHKMAESNKAFSHFRY